MLKVRTIIFQTPAIFQKNLERFLTPIVLLIHMIPDFDENGNLPSGIHYSTFDEFKQNFVIDFVTSSTRHPIYNGYISYCKQIVSFDIIAINWIVGSFTTSKINPQDIDIVVHFYSNNHCSTIDQLEFEIGFQYADQNDTKKGYHCHAFYVPIYPKDDPRYVLTVTFANKWKKLFSSDRDENARGLIELDLENQRNKEVIKIG